VFLEKLIEWEFDEQRQEKALKLQDMGDKALEKNFNMWLDEYYLFGEYEDALKVFISDLENKIPQFIKDAFRDLKESILVVSYGFGATIGNSKNDMLQYLEKKGYLPNIIEPYLDIVIAGYRKSFKKSD
jgi:hypothetical protein